MEKYKRLFEAISYDGSIIPLLIPSFNEKIDSIYLSQEISDKTDSFYTKLIPLSTSMVKTSRGDFSILKKSGKKIHSDDFYTIFTKAKKTGGSVYTLDSDNVDVVGKGLMPSTRQLEVFDGRKGKWVTVTIPDIF